VLSGGIERVLAGHGGSLVDRTNELLLPSITAETAPWPGKWLVVQVGFSMVGLL
jgi:hypothetical protein